MFRSWPCQIWRCVSTNRGMTIMLEASMLRAPSPGRLGPTAAIFDPSISTSALSKSPSRGSIVRTTPPLSSTRCPGSPDAGAARLASAAGTQPASPVAAALTASPAVLEAGDAGRGGVAVVLAVGPSISVGAPLARHVYQGSERAAIACAGHDPRQANHVRALVAPRSAKVHALAVMDPHRLAAKRARHMHAHREVVDVRRVKERAGQIAARHE